MTSVRFSSSITVPVERLFAFHCDVTNFAAISPPIPPMRILRAPVPTHEGDVQAFSLGWGPLAMRWDERIVRLVPGRLLEDVQERGPLLRWGHRHYFTEQGPGSRLTDSITFRMFPTAAGEFLEYWTVRPALYLWLRWRHRRTSKLLAKRLGVDSRS